MEFLTQLALDSNAIYHYRTASDQEAVKVFCVTEEHLKKGIIRLMMEGSDVIGFFGLFSLHLHILNH
jgi:hypothetical protein